MKPDAAAGAVLLYHAPGDLRRNVDAYLGRLSRLYVVDNSPDGHAADITPLIEHPGVVYLPQETNVGVAAGLNVAVRRAEADGFEWLLTLDQDSRVTTRMIDEMLKTLAEADDPQVALVSPFQRCAKSGRPPAEPWEIVDWAMTSGSLVRLRVCLDLGAFDAALFIDGVDHEYCLRLRNNGYRILRANRAILDHEPGRPTKALFGTLVISHHEPERHYYRTRNRFVIGRAGGASFALCAAVSGLEALLVLLYERPRMKKLRMMARGFADYRRNRLGRL